MTDELEPPTSDYETPKLEHRAELVWAVALDHVEHVLASMSAARRSPDYALALYDAAEIVRVLPLPDDLQEPAAGPSSTWQLVAKLVLRLQREKHDQARGAHPMFSVDHWRHNAGKDWPHEPDDGSWELFENCEHPDCKLARSLVSSLLVVGPVKEGE